MINWEHVYVTDFALPSTTTLDEAVSELVACLRDPDPELRDGYPYVVLRTWIARDVIDGPRRIRLGDEMAARFTDPHLHVRAFAPLVLDMIVSRGDFRRPWLDAFADWYPTETELRGHDNELGWLHAVAHGADLLGTFGTHPEVDPVAMLDLAVARLLAPTDHVLRDQEDDRLACALARILTDPRLSPGASVDWLDPVEAAFAALGGGPTPPHISHTMRTLRALYVLADTGFPARRDGGPLLRVLRPDPLKARLAKVLAPVFDAACSVG
ncbi:DUF2785 domain-containing protein [Streptomyces sp. NPDC001282]|uniref:DUF2785 domain-containing protein n=1 Tax=Streptomyces sp. NPDC001282 TaxID=3364557 RepID=UPI0036C6AADF